MAEFQTTPDRAGDSGRSGLVNALLGAVATTVFSWIPFAPVVGGTLAGYLEADEPPAERSASSRALRVGALSGLLATAPAILVIGFVASIFTVGWLGVGLGGVAEPGLGLGAVLGVPLVAWGFVAFGVVSLAAYHVALGALGGWLGAKLAERDDRAFATERRPAQRTLDESYDDDVASVDASDRNADGGGE